MDTFGTAIEEYLQHLASLRYSPRTLRKARGYLGRFAAWLRDAGVGTADRLRVEHLRRWHTEVTGRTFRGRPLKPASINRHLIVVRGCLERLARQGLVHRRLIEELPYVKEPSLLPGSVLTHAQVQQVLAAVPGDSSEGCRNRAMLELLYSAGVRASELLGLDVGDVDFRNAVMRVTGKGQKQRMVPVGRRALRLLEGYIAAVRPFIVRDPAEQALFVGGSGVRLSYPAFWRLVRSCGRKSGLEVNVTPHTFRRSCTTELIRGGANMYHVKELLGHESLDTFKHYARLTIQDLKKEHRRCHPRERDAAGESE